MNSLSYNTDGLRPLETLELQKLNGGRLDPVSLLVGYVIGEALNGIWEGIVRPW